MYVRYSDDQKRVIQANPLNRNNCRHLPETLRIAERELKAAETAPKIYQNAKAAKEQAQKLAAARDLVEEKRYLLSVYRELFPDLFDNKKTGY